jgi:hypothetical protein
MTTFLNFHVFAAARGEGLHPELRLLFERAATSSVSDLVIRHDGFLQSGPDPASETVQEHVKVSAVIIRSTAGEIRTSSSLPREKSPGRRFR